MEVPYQTENRVAIWFSKGFPGGVHDKEPAGLSGDIRDAGSICE